MKADLLKQSDNKTQIKGEIKMVLLKLNNRKVTAKNVVKKIGKAKYDSLKNTAKDFLDEDDNFIEFYIGKNDVLRFERA